MPAEHDVDLVVYDAFFKDAGPGTIVDVGAARPDYLSISESFRDRGWRVIPVEPNPEFCRMYRERGFEVCEYACSDEDRDHVEFQVVDSLQSNYFGGELSYESFSSLGIKGQFADLQKQVNTQTRTIHVNVRKLDTILRTHAPDLQTFEILAVDVEGWELSVLRGFSIEKFRPKVVILENLFKTEDYRNAMKQRGYALWKTLEPNEVYLREESPPKRAGFFSRLFASR